MALRNCKQCGKVFMYDGVHKICKDCLDENERDFLKVKNYLRENPSSSIQTVSEETEVEKKKIIEYIRDNRLIAEDIKIEFTIKCERCGREIKHGKLCDRCINDLKEEIEEINKEKEKQNRKLSNRNMHVKERINNSK